ncbi:CHAD domain-containing protein [Streptacidiphilus sp. N1-12]|uniref:CHAD domain-containing protein n=2 Tax=Streptacidiphilus alkalitolerans TaxID=3342712 RepID=A0ABV6V7Q9_9ACTN
MEKERKFDGSGDAALPVLDGIPGVAQITDAEPEDLDAVYYDTADLRLLARGVTLRRRTGGHDAGWHLKLPVGPDVRSETRLPLSAGAPGRVPRELVLRTRALTRGGALTPVVHLRTHRRRRLLLDGRQRSLAEIAQDTVSAQVLAAERLRPKDAAPLVPAQRGSGAEPGRGGGSSTVVTGWTEVEAELVKGGTELLDAVERRFAQAGLRRSTSPSKLARALGRPDPGPGPDAPEQPAPGSIGAAVTALLREQSAQLLALDPAVRADEPDAVHAMRVAVRRLRSTLRIHRRQFAEEPAGTVAAELRWLGTVLGEARDQEVLGALLAAQIAELSAEECPGPVGERVGSRTAAQYRRSWKRASSTLDAPRYYALLDAVEALAARPGLRPRARGSAVGAFERTVRSEQRRVDRRIAGASATPAGPARDAALHEARKAAKRARYAGEGAVACVGRPARRLARRMKAVQELLGVRQDALLACAALPGLARTAHLAGEEGFGYGVLYARQRAAIAQVDRDLPAVWRAACERKLTRFR